MNIHDENATWVTDEQLADALGSLQDAQQIALEGCDVHIGRHPARGRMIVIAASAGMSLVLTARPAGEDAPIDADNPKSVYARIAADPRVERISYTRDEQLRIAVTLNGATRGVKVAPERADDAVAQLTALLRRAAA